MEIKMKLSRQLIYLVIAITVGFVALGLYGLHSLKNNLIEGRKHEIQTVLSLAKSHAKIYIDQHNQGLLTREQAEEKVIEVLSGYSFGSSYIWSNDNNAISRVHIRPEKLNKFQKSYKVQMAALQGKEFIFTVKNNKKPGTDKRVIKVNVGTKLPGWNWALGFGVYMDDINETYWEFALNLLLISLGIIVVVISLTILMFKRIINLLGGEPSYAVEITNKIAQGDLSVDIQGDFSQHSLLGSISVMQRSLRKMVESIHAGSSQLTVSTEALNHQISNIINASKGSSDASIQTAAAIVEMSACIKGISQSTGKTERNSENSFEMCKEGVFLVEQSGEIINQISTQITGSIADFQTLQERTHQIGSIVGVIKDIAEQTNLLALNAAIEAARAGDQGRGFAVVADEVRTLASRTAIATTEITETIKVIQSDTDVVSKALGSILPKVEESVESSTKVMKMLSEVQGSSTDTLEMIREVASATSEQEQASDELTEHVQNISSMVQDTVKSIGQCKETVTDLDELAKELHTSVGYFSLK